MRKPRPPPPRSSTATYPPPPTAHVRLSPQAPKPAATLPHTAAVCTFDPPSSDLSKAHPQLRFRQTVPRRKPPRPVSPPAALIQRPPSAQHHVQEPSSPDPPSCSLPDRAPGLPHYHMLSYKDNPAWTACDPLPHCICHRTTPTPKQPRDRRQSPRTACQRARSCPPNPHAGNGLHTNPPTPPQRLITRNPLRSSLTKTHTNSF